MFNCLTLEEFTRLAQRHRRVAVYARLPADQYTPVGVYQKLAAEGAPSFILESLGEHGKCSRYSFVGFKPTIFVETSEGGVSVHRDGEIKTEPGDPFDTLEELMASYRVAVSEALPPLAGGVIGYCTYDSIRFVEDIPDRHKGVEDDIPDMRDGFYEELVAFDNFTQSVYIIRIVKVSEDIESSYIEGIDAIAKIREQLRGVVPSVQQNVSNGVSDTDLEVDLDDDAYKALVEQAKEHIVAGDAFQIVLSRRFRRRVRASSLDVYRSLRMTNPSPYMFYLQYGDFAVAGASPERIVSVIEGEVETHPVAGTRPRKDGTEGLALEKELAADPKEKAEHMMLVDLARNDLGRLSTPGTVEVPELMTIQRLSKVIHLASRVTGQLAAEHSSVDALKYTFPAGTLSGAPKIRAMELIDTMETSRRGLYGGTVFYLDNRGNLDACIAIRMAVLKDGVATVRAGAGIVYDSVPQSEADETRHKASAVLHALELAEEGLPC